MQFHTDSDFNANKRDGNRAQSVVGCLFSCVSYSRMALVYDLDDGFQHKLFGGPFATFATIKQRRRICGDIRSGACM